MDPFKGGKAPGGPPEKWRDLLPAAPETFLPLDRPPNWPPPGMPARAALVEPDRLELRFRERLASRREDYYRFAVAAAFVSAGFLAVLWFAAHALPAVLGIPLGRTASALIAGVGVVLCLAAGAARERWLRRKDEFAEALLLAGGWAFWVFPGAFPFGLLVPLYLVSSLPWYLLKEAVKGRRILASEEAASIALEVVREGGEKVEREFLVPRLRRDFAGTVDSVRLLVELDLYRVRGRGPTLHLLRTMSGEDFVRGR